MERIYIGAAYYPEMWNENEIDKDIERCRKLGINTLRVGEFAWGKMEPQEGKFDFSWLLKVVDKLYENNIFTVMCTPTATPPRWLLNKYSEMRMIRHEGHREEVSSRCHTCKTSTIMREKNRSIVTEMAKVFSTHKGIIGWQIDNEIWPYHEGCYCEQCKNAFREYLKDKFNTTKNLNKAWGLARWSLEYDDFSDVQPPYPREWRHPSLRKAWRDFQCRQIKTYVEEQADILHSYGCKKVGTDMMMHNSLSYYQMNEKLDVVQYNHYDTANNLIGTVFAYDFLRCVLDRPFWVTETQVGWNGSEVADCGFRPVGNCYVNTWLPIARGAEANMYWLFRTHPNGHELAHGALYSTAGRAYRVSEEVQKASAEFEKCKEFLTSTHISSKIAIHYSSTAHNSFECAPMITNFIYRKALRQRYHEAFKHYNVDVIDTPHSLVGYEVLISPFLATVDENGLKGRVIEWVKQGGTWIVGPMSDMFDENISKYTNAPYSFLEDFVGVYTKYQKPLGNDVFKAKWNDGTDCELSMWYDAYELLDGTTSLANYTDGEFTPLSVIAERKIGKGKVILLGSVISHTDLLKLVDREPIAQASENIVLTERSGEQKGIIAIEIKNQNGYIVLEKEYKELLSGKVMTGKIEILPHQVFVFVLEE